MKHSRSIAVAAFLLCLFSFATLNSARRARAQAGAPQSAQTGWLEGTVLSTEGQILKNTLNQKTGGVTLRVTTDQGTSFEVFSDPKLGGLYSLRNLKPGLYEVTVLDAYIGPAKFRPQRLHGVLVKPGVRTVLNVEMEPGETLQQIGRPVVATETALIVSDELARLRKEVDALKGR